MTDDLISNLEFLLARLERISADSVVAHRASGVRGAMLRALENHEKGQTPPDLQLKRLAEAGYFLLQKAAREIGR